MDTKVLKVERPDELGSFATRADGTLDLSRWHVTTKSDSKSTVEGEKSTLAPIEEAGKWLQTNDTPVAFPTETVYGLGADATRSAAVRGIYAAKGRPADNPLIVHVCDLQMLKSLLTPAQPAMQGTEGVLPHTMPNGNAKGNTPSADIPAIYDPLIQRFWPGPLTILLRNPTPSHFAPEVTAGLPTFGARLPDSPLALTLIQRAGVPLAAPSANASTRPSPTTAAHVVHDLAGKVGIVLDGGACTVGVESTVVDGLCDPPAVLRPGGVSIDELRACSGWEGVVKAYRDESEKGGAAPRAPGMKYKHYSPKARVVLFEAGSGKEDLDAGDVLARSEARRIGVIRTRSWKAAGGLPRFAPDVVQQVGTDSQHGDSSSSRANGVKMVYEVQEGSACIDKDGASKVRIIDINLGQDTRSIAQGLFSALRELDARGVDVIYIEGVADSDDIAAAVMNRLRKAASEIRS